MIQLIAGSHSSYEKGRHHFGGSLLSGFTKKSSNSNVVFGFHFLENFVVS